MPLDGVHLRQLEAAEPLILLWPNMDGFGALTIQSAVTRQVVRRIEPSDPLAVEPVAIRYVYGRIVKRTNMKFRDVFAWETHRLRLPSHRRSAITTECPSNARGGFINLGRSICVSNPIRIICNPDNDRGAGVMSAILTVTISHGHRTPFALIANGAAHAATCYSSNRFGHEVPSPP